MKRLFLIISTILTLAACSNEGMLVSPKGAKIAFGESHIDNSTRKATDGSYSGTKELTAFKVYGTVTGNGYTLPLYETGANVTGNVGDAVWGCTIEQYWVPMCQYKFIAIADATSVSLTNGMPTSITYNENTTANGDLLLAIVDDTTNDQAEPSKGNPVEFTFIHLLSKAKFTFTKNAYRNTRYTFNVKNIKFTDAYKQGTYTINANDVNGGTWGSQGVEGEILFGNLENIITAENAATGLQSQNERQFVPAKYTKQNPLTVQFDVVMILDGNELSTVTHTKQIPASDATYDDYTFVKGNAYNFGVTLGDNNLITFKVDEIDGWDSKTDISIP